MSLSLGLNSLWWGCFGLNCAQLAPGIRLQHAGLNWHFWGWNRSLLLVFSVEWKKWRDLQTCLFTWKNVLPNTPPPPPPLSATCVNLAASFLCDDCKSGYTGNNCETGKNFAQVFRKVIASKENFYAFSSLFSSHSVRVVMDLTWRRSLGSRRCSDPPFPFLTFDYTDSFSVPLSFLGQNLYLLLLYFKTGQPTTVFSLKHFSGYQE